MGNEESGFSPAGYQARKCGPESSVGLLIAERVLSSLADLKLRVFSILQDRVRAEHKADLRKNNKYSTFPSPPFLPGHSDAKGLHLSGNHEKRPPRLLQSQIFFPPLLVSQNIFNFLFQP